MTRYVAQRRVNPIISSWERATVAAVSQCFNQTALGRRLSVASDPGSDGSGSHTGKRGQLRSAWRRRSRESAHSVELGDV